ncbi:MAG: zinc ribbon domain-containing protein [Armatimonadetes bacterium]|nr:zinc ribbon domain-containing protein [Armatimonadota bacterium]MDE2206981.1 zinc ribbon domain-containing protein [Armatimonadota bacterium]
MIKCPKCQATLPDGWTKCQFCGAEFAKQPPLPSDAGAEPEELTELRIAPAPTWAASAVRAVAIWWIVNGVWSAVSAMIHGGYAAGGLCALNVLTAIVGVGILRQAPIARTVTNVLCWLQIASGLFDFVVGFFVVSIAPILGVMMMLLAIIQAGVAAFMIYLLAETDVNSPNF